MNLIEQSEDFVGNLLKDKLSNLYSYHNFNHTLRVVAAVKQLIDEVKKYGGTFCFIWHNETLAEAGKWKGWKQVFDHTLERLK